MARERSIEGAPVVVVAVVVSFASACTALCWRLDYARACAAPIMEPEVPSSHALPPLPGGALLDIAALPAAATPDDVVLGGRVWLAAPALCGWMSSVTEQFAGRRVLEVGAGTGACGLYAAALGASRVVLTEGGSAAEALLPLMEQNLERNRARLPEGVRVEVMPLHWGREPLPAGPFDWIIGSDVTWGSDHESHDALCIPKRLARDRR